MHSESPHPTLRWDIFCRVIDNFGDLGVCWRLACNLVARGQTARLWVDDLAAMDWLAPTGAAGVQICHWTAPLDTRLITPGDVLVEAFGCDIDIEFIASYAYMISTTGQKCHWINLEYLSAEAYVSRCHGLPSPVMSGPGAGLSKHFFYPGLTAETGGLLREPELGQRQAQFDRQLWLTKLGINWQGKRLVSLFCYEPAGLGPLLDQLAADTQHPTCMLVTPGRAKNALLHEIFNKSRLKSPWNKHNALTFFYLPQLTQIDFDHLLWACDINFVRGEDSLVRALWAGKPLVWQIYPQLDNAHVPKLEAFLNWLNAPASLREFHALWNGLEPDAEVPDFVPMDWQDCITRAKAQLLAQQDLATQLLGFVAKTH